MSTDHAEVRADVLAANLAEVTARIVAAARAAGRGADDVTLIGVSKTFPASDVRLLYDLGVRDFGENRDQEAAGKAAELRAGGIEPRWHFVGQLQRNKAASVARYAAVVHSVDRVQLADALARAAGAAGRTLDVLVQVSLDELAEPAEPAEPDGKPGTAGRAGAVAADVGPLAEHIAGLAGLRLAGVMGLAPLGGDPDRAFGRLVVQAEAVRAVAAAAQCISAGMSADLEAAIRHGATHVRVGTALFGDRPLMSEHVR